MGTAVLGMTAWERRCRDDNVGMMTAHGNGSEGQQHEGRAAGGYQCGDDDMGMTTMGQQQHGNGVTTWG